MKFTETKLKGAFIIEMEPHIDDRGFFARSWCAEEFGRHGLDARLSQCNVSFNDRKGTLRGLHYQIKPHEETKLVRCTRGAIYDVIVDLRPQSTTYKKWIGVDLTAVNYKMLYIPRGFAHGFQTMEKNSEVFYQMSDAYVADSARGIRWNDPALKINWPLPDPLLSSRDQSFPDFDL